MEKKLQQRDLRKHFEGILGREFVDLSDGELNLYEYTAAWSINKGHQTSREIGTTGNSTKVCSDFSVLSIGGLARTGTDGKTEFLLSEYHCAFVFYYFPIVFVATAQSQEPDFVTTRTFEVHPMASGKIEDVRIEIYAWEPSGTPAKSKLVKWFCQLPVEIRIP